MWCVTLPCNIWQCQSMIDVRCLMTFPHYLPIVPACPHPGSLGCCIMRWRDCILSLFTYYGATGLRAYGGHRIELSSDWRHSLLLCSSKHFTDKRQGIKNYYCFNTKRYLPCHSLRTGSHNITVTTVEFFNDKYSDGSAFSLTLEVALWRQGTTGWVYELNIL